LPHFSEPCKGVHIHERWASYHFFQKDSSILEIIRSLYEKQMACVRKMTTIDIKNNIGNKESMLRYLDEMIEINFLGDEIDKIIEKYSNDHPDEENFMNQYIIDTRMYGIRGMTVKLESFELLVMFLYNN
jgi:hypothetical protein